ncbi:hypothetical protein [Saccharothrix variisporea]|uniref:Ribbon-helix-helix CopG family protein n=1 Tax=Saccharothrix variisporea TaxID=543527 RepID=A0A495X5N6_9PSEU|nr:hypothetical protein [Saccharothrix variisporea]RKT68414.1 hypothetical protein DFJ66_1598 [Saccharothrix variisporea]
MSEHEVKPVQIRDVPVGVIEVLQARASAEGISLTAYLRRFLVELANTPTMAEVYHRSWPRPWEIDGATLLAEVAAAREGDE